MHREELEEQLAARFEMLFAENKNLQVVLAWSLGLVPNEDPYKAFAALLIDSCDDLLGTQVSSSLMEDLNGNR